MRPHLLLIGFVWAACACSEDSPGPAGTGGTGSGGTSSGGAATGGSTSASGGVTQGGASASGGAAGSTSSPAGKVDACYGDACPRGECEAAGAFQAHCADVYPEPVGPSSMYCAAGASGEYCLRVVSAASFDYFAVTCSAGSASFVSCPIGCNFTQSKARCN
jgi:hypothetical protein